MNRTTFLTGRRVVKVSAGFLVGESEVVTPISGSMAVGPGLCSPPPDRLSPAPSSPRAVWPQHLPCRGTRGWGQGLARSLGSHHGTEVAPLRRSEAWGAQAPPHTHTQSRSLASRRWLQKAALGQEGSRKLKLYLSPGWAASSDLLALAFRICFQKAPNWVYWNMRKTSGLVIRNFWGDCVLLPDLVIYLFIWWK